ncbi:hypothetical protein Tco_0105635 [Tanacetum coccineum]
MDDLPRGFGRRCRRACDIDFSGSYQLSIRCAPFEALYGRKCKSPVLWAEIGESSLIGPEFVQETTYKVILIKENIKSARDHQKSYVDCGRKPLEFEVGDRVLLRLYEELNSVHDTFNVSNLKKCLADANLHVPLNEIKMDKTLRFVKEHVEIMDREVKSLKRSRIPLVKVRWNSKRGPEFTWECEDYMKSKYPQLFPLPAAVSPTADSPGYITESDPEEDPKEEDGEDPEEDPTDYLADRDDD